MAEAPVKTKTAAAKRTAAKSAAARTVTREHKIPREQHDSGQSGFACVLAIYALYLAGAVLVVPFALVFVGFLIALFAKDRFRSTIYAAHLDNQIKIFLYTLLVAVVLLASAAVLLVYPLLSWLYLVLWVLLYIWFVYQAVIGILAVIDKKTKNFSWY